MSKLFLSIIGSFVLAFGANVALAQEDESEKIQLINSIFAEQLKQPQQFRDQAAEQLEAKFKEIELPKSAQKKALKILADNTDKMSADIMDILVKSYSLEELRAKDSFESSELSKKLHEQDKYIIAMMRSFGQVISREIMVDSISKRFPDDVDNISLLVEKFSEDTTTVDSERVALAVEKLKTNEQGAIQVLSFLSLGRSQVLSQQQYLNLSDKGISRKHIKLAKKYAKLANLFDVINDTMSKVPGGLDKEIQKNIRGNLVLGIARHIDKDLLKEANKYFSKDIAQSIVKKDIVTVAEITSAVQVIVAKINSDITPMVTEK